MLWRHLVFPLGRLGNFREIEPSFTNGDFMGLFQAFSNLLSGSNKQANILILGLDNSGKTTILNQLKPPDVQSSNIVPTVGYSIEKFTAANINFSAYDMSGQSRYRNLWLVERLFAGEETDRVLGRHTTKMPMELYLLSIQPTN